MKITLASVHGSGQGTGHGTAHGSGHAPGASSVKALRVKVARSRSKSAATEALVADYGERIARFAGWEAHRFASEAALLQWVRKQQGRTAAHLVLLDGRGKQFASEQFAARLGALRDRGAQQIVFAVGPADGWSRATLDSAHLLVSLGSMTLPHELARAVVAEQIYRALTILAGHPYHCGHE